MSKKIYLFSLVLLALAFVSCSETEEVGKYDNWRAMRHLLTLLRMFMLRLLVEEAWNA